MNKTNCKLTLSLNGDQFNYLKNLAMDINMSVSQLLNRFAVDLLADPMHCNSSQNQAVSWYCLQLNQVDSPGSFIHWLTDHQFHRFFFCMFDSLLCHVTQTLKKVPETHMSFQDLCLEQVNALIRQRFSSGVKPGDLHVFLGMEDFSSPVQDHIREIFRTMEFIHAYYLKDQDAAPNSDSCCQDFLDLFCIWKDTVCRY